MTPAIHSAVPGRRGARAALPAAAAALAVLAGVLAGCGAAVAPSDPGATLTGPGAPPTGGERLGPDLPSRIVVADGHGWHGAAVDGPRAAAGSCRFGTVAGQAVPDPRCTPGAVDPGVTQANLSRTLCRPGGWTASVRPPREVTDAFKRVARRAYAAPGPSSAYELDHLVPLGLGGASDARNLWPEPNAGDPAQFDHSRPIGSNAKDGVESRLHTAVCRGEVSLAAAQRAVATNWYTAETVLGVRP